jgi:hypothetical protein
MQRASGVGLKGRFRGRKATVRVVPDLSEGGREVIPIGKCLTAVQCGLKIASIIEFDDSDGVHLGTIGLFTFRGDKVAHVRGVSAHLP